VEDRSAHGARKNDAGSGRRRRPKVRPQEGYQGRRGEPLPTRVDDLPPLPAAYRDVLETGLVRLGLDLPPAVGEAIDTHVRLLLAWTAAVNLTAVREPVAVARLHVLDSLTAVPLLRDRGVTRFADLGSGGGFPGLPLALVLPADRAVLVESIGKKAHFLDVVVEAARVGGRVVVAATRAESLSRTDEYRERWPAVTARAVASLGELVELAFPLLSVGGVLVAWKRGTIGPELAAARSAVRALGGGRVEVVEADVGGLEGHVLVVADKAGPTDSRYPRDPAVRRRRPW
jgi:16S rRNA (guanine527-N7)-methyltransferase